MLKNSKVVLFLVRPESLDPTTYILQYQVVLEHKAALSFETSVSHGIFDVASQTTSFFSKISVTIAYLAV